MSGAAAAFVDGHGRIAWWSREAEHLLGWSAPEALGRPARDFVLAGPRSGRDRPGRLRLRHRSGAAVLADVRLSESGSSTSRLVTAVPVCRGDGTAGPGEEGREAGPGETPERENARRLADAYRSAFEIGGSLDVVRTARELVEVLVPAFGDLVSVDFPDDVLQGRDPPRGYPGVEASAPRRVAVKSADGEWPRGLLRPGEAIPVIEDQPSFASVAVGGAFVVDAETSRAILGHDPELTERMMPAGMRTALVCPLYHRSRLFGSVLIHRTVTAEPFGPADIRFVQDLCDRTATALDHAFRYTREHQTAVALQRGLLPPATTRTAACETAGTYQPAGSSVTVGGDWFDTVPLSSMRTALVIGDVTGHGLRAATTMARLRTAVQTLADLDLPPDEILTRLDDLVQRMAAEAEHPDTVGATCLFAVYDPLTGVCQSAGAGHPPPAVLFPDGGTELLDLVPGPPLGVGDQPFEVSTTVLPEGAVLALYTDGLTGRDPAGGQAWLLRELAAAGPSLPSLARAGDALMSRRRTDPGLPGDDATLLLARLRRIADGSTATWQYPADPAAVHDARRDTTAQLHDWGLDEHVFATELVVSELVTNAVRYAGGPILVRLIHEDILVCEVSDPSNTQPRLRRALNTDEGGRGLFLIAQLTARWGCRYGPRGKTIWTEQLLTPEP